MRVLHDWDSVQLSGRKTLREGLALILYAVSKVLPFLNRVGSVRIRNRALERERLDHMETLIMLDHLVGVEAIFGLREEIVRKYPEEIERLRERYKIEVRAHHHIGSPPDPDRVREWFPPLSQSMSSWTFEKDFIEGGGTLEPGDLPIFHVDNPENLKHYIRYLYKMKLNENQ